MYCRTYTVCNSIQVCRSRIATNPAVHYMHVCIYIRMCMELFKHDTYVYLRIFLQYTVYMYVHTYVHLLLHQSICTVNKP